MRSLASNPSDRVNLHLHVVRVDFRRRAHLQHSVYDQLAVGRQQIPSPVKLLQPLHFRALADWGRGGVGCGWNTWLDVKWSRSTKKKKKKDEEKNMGMTQKKKKREGLITQNHIMERKERRTKPKRGEWEFESWDDGFSRWKSKITSDCSYGCDTMWLQSFSRLIKWSRRRARVNGIFSRKEIALIFFFFWFTSVPLPSEWSLIPQLIENTVHITKSLPGISNKTIAFYYMFKNQ